MTECKHDWEIVEYNGREFGLMVDSECKKCGALRYMCVNPDENDAHWVDWVRKQ